MNKRLSFLAIFALAAVLVLGWVAQNTGYNSNHFDTSSVGNIAIKSSALLTNTMFQDSGTGPSVLVSDQIGLSSVQKIFEVDDNMATPKLYVTGDGHVHSDGAFSALTPSFSGAVTVNSVSYTANTILSLDGSKVMVSTANGGANTFLEGTTPPAYRALLQADIPAIVTNANNSVSIIPFQWGELTTNNNVVLNNAILAGGTLSTAGITWGVMFMSNSSAATKTLLIPASVAVSGTALGSTTTAFCTNAGILTVWAMQGVLTGAVWRSYP